jgi:DNA-binding transcriptional ArsR family regulator
MDSDIAVRALGALAHGSRLAVFRLLVQAGDELSAGIIAEQLGLTPQALSFHLKDLSAAELIAPRYEGRRIFYRARYDSMNGLIQFLTENCCQGASCAVDSDSSCCA